MKKKTILIVLSVSIIAGCYLFAQADPAPVNVGPPTIETHLANINSNMQLIKWAGTVLVALVGVISSLVVFIFMSTVGNLKGSIGHVEKKAEKALKKTDHIEENFMSIATHDRICPGGH